MFYCVFSLKMPCSSQIIMFDLLATPRDLFHLLKTVFLSVFSSCKVVLVRFVFEFKECRK